MWLASIIQILLVSCTSFNGFAMGGTPSDNCLKQAKEMTSANSDTEFIKFFKDCVEVPYGFKMSEEKTMWDKPLPDFGEEVKQDSKSFKVIAQGIEKFFQKESNGKVRNWTKIKSSIENLGQNNKCENMLYIVAARQLYVIYVMQKVSEYKMQLCEEEGEDKIFIPDKVCYPKNPGSARCTSDYDVGLIGPRSGPVVKAYGKYFTDTFKMTSETLFDNNVYAYDIEVSMPELFTLSSDADDNARKHKKFLENVKNKYETEKYYQMQDLALAYFKVLMYDSGNTVLLNQALKYFKTGNSYGKALQEWATKLDEFKAEFKDAATNSEKEEEIMKKRKEKYELYVNSIDKPEENQPMALENSAIARIYASEAYLTRGAMRVVVGAQQMKKAIIEKNLTPLDHWTAFIENYGDLLKDYKRECQENKMNLYGCLLKLSKYMWRTFKSIETLLGGLKVAKIVSHRDDKDFYTPETEGSNAIQRFNSATPSPVKIANNWVKCFKDKARSEIDKKYSDKSCPDEGKLGNSDEKNWAYEFIEQVLGCKDGKTDKELMSDCIDKIRYLVRAVNQRMTELAKKEMLTNKEILKM